MLFSKRSILLGLVYALTSVEAVKYGNNHVPVRPDDEIVEAAFPEPNVTLLAPAFTSPDTVQADFTNGSSGPTDDYELGELRRKSTGEY